MAFKTPSLKLKELPLSFARFYNKPVFDPTYPNCIILSTDSNQVSGGIYRYNLANNEITSLTKYAEHETIDNNLLNANGQFIDSKHNILYLFGGGHASFVTYDINTRRIRIGTANDNYHDELANCDYFGKTVHITTCSKNEIHIVGLKKHYKFDCIQQKITEICDLVLDQYSKLSYNPVKNELMTSYLYI